jgi:hypothetical protein
MMRANELRIMAATVLTFALGAAGCGKGAGASGASIEFTKAAMKSLPAVSTAGASGPALSASGAPGAVSGALGTGTLADYQSLAYLFKMECQHVPNDNYCPPTVHPSSDINDPTRFTMGSLIGMVYHAQMYTGSLVTACSEHGLSPVAVSAGSYAAGDAANPAADPARFILDDYSLYTCRSTNVGPGCRDASILGGGGRLVPGSAAHAVQSTTAATAACRRTSSRCTCPWTPARPGSWRSTSRRRRPMRRASSCWRT